MIKYNREGEIIVRGKRCIGDSFDCYQCEIFKPHYSCRHRTKYSDVETNAPGKRWIDHSGIQHCNDFTPESRIEQLTLF